MHVERLLVCCEWNKERQFVGVIGPLYNKVDKFVVTLSSSGSRGVPRGPCPPPPRPVQISHNKDGRQRRPHRFHVSCPPSPPGRWIRCCYRLVFCGFTTDKPKLKTELNAHLHLPFFLHRPASTQGLSSTLHGGKIDEHISDQRFIWKYSGLWTLDLQ